MKKLMKASFTALVLVLSLANCGKSGSNNNDPNTYYPYNPAYGANNPNMYNQQYQQMYGQGNYCSSGASYGYSGCTVCQVPQCSYSQSYYGGGCGSQNIVYYPPGYAGYGGGYNGGYNQGGGSFFIGGSW